MTHIQSTPQYLVCWVLMIMTFTACEAENTPENNFELFWEDFDRHYAQFEHKGIDWDAVYDTYRPRVTEESSDAELFDILSEMAGLLNDGHVELYGDDRTFQSGIVGQTATDDFELANVEAHYLRMPLKAGEDVFTYGWLTDDIGYVHIYQISGEGSYHGQTFYKGIDDALAYLYKARALVVDVRGNFGGEDPYAYKIAGRFTDRKRAATKTTYRNGPHHDDFGPTKTWTIEPQGDRQFLGPVVLLTNVFTMSAAENFTMAMLTLPNVTQMGSSTAGAMAMNLERELLNGWFYTVTIGLFTDADDNCYEGIGFKPAPENTFTNSEEQLEAGIDSVLEAAIARLSE